MKKFFTGIEFKGGSKIKNLILEAFTGPGSAAVGSITGVGSGVGIVLNSSFYPVDGIVTNLDKGFLPGTVHITDSNINVLTFAVTDTIRGQSVQTGHIVMVSNQTTSSENGFYVMGTTNLEFVRSFDSAGSGSFVYPAHDSSTLYIFKYNGTTGSITTVGGSSIAWGAITGTLADQTDLQSALNAKLDSSSLQESVEDIIGSKVVAGTGISVSYNDTTGETTVTNTASGSGSKYVATITSQTSVTITAATHGMTDPVVQVRGTDNIVVDCQIEIQDDHDVILTFSESFSGKVVIL